MKEMDSRSHFLNWKLFLILILKIITEIINKSVEKWDTFFMVILQN